MTEKDLDASKSVLRKLLDAQKLTYCQDCGACTSSCPMAKVVPEHYNPRRLMGRIHLDLDKAVEGDDLWLCAWCYRCTERCTQGLQPTEVFLVTRNFVADKSGLPENPRRLIEEITKSGRTMPAPGYVDELREEYGLPKIGESAGDEAVAELHKIMGADFMRRIERRP